MTVSFTPLSGATYLGTLPPGTDGECGFYTAPSVAFIQLYYAEMIPLTAPFHAGAVQKNVPLK